MKRTARIVLSAVGYCTIAVTVLLLTACGDGSTGFAPTSTQAAADPPRSPSVVFIGDSITADWTDLTSLVANSINAGARGQTSVEILARFKVDVLSLHPATVVIEAGTDDLLYAHDPAFFDGPLNDVKVANIDSISEMAEEAAAAGVQVWIASIVDTSMPQHNVSAEDVSQFNAQLSICVSCTATVTSTTKGFFNCPTANRTSRSFLPATSIQTWLGTHTCGDY